MQNLRDKDVWLYLLVVLLLFSGKVTAESGLLPKAKTMVIEEFIKGQMRLGNIPGIAVVIVHEGNVYQKGFGYADLRRKLPVTAGTMFELGSTSKAFTALGIADLKRAGRIHGDADVRQYLPWLKLRYVPKSNDPTLVALNQNKVIRNLLWFERRRTAAITIDQLLRHTSGIPAETLADIPRRSDPQALEATVRNLTGQELDYPPGERFLYSTINYDILGLVIQTVSGQSFESYMKDKILAPLGLKQISFAASEIGPGKMATGYKIGFGMPLIDRAPRYRGNTPAGYYLANAEMMLAWLRLQLGNGGAEANLLIEQSHQDEYAYSYGWNIYRVDQKIEKIWHAGNNPNYSSYIECRPQEKSAVAVLANLNSNYSQVIGEGVLALLNENSRLPVSSYDLFQEVDKVSGIVILAVLFLLILTFATVKKRWEEKRKYCGLNRKNRRTFVTWSILFLAVLGLLYSAPWLVFGYPWRFVLVWGPISFPVAIGLIFLEVSGCFGLLVNRYYFKVNRVNQRHQFNWRSLFQ